jgi:hypothetical protein
MEKLLNMSRLDRLRQKIGVPKGDTISDVAAKIGVFLIFSRSVFKDT